MIRAVVVATTFDLRPFLAHLTQQGIGVKVSEESGELAIWVVSEADAQQVRDMFTDWQESVAADSHSTDTTSLNTLFPVKNISLNLLRSFLLAPVTVILIAACMLVAVLSSLGNNLQAVSYLFYPLLNFSVGDGVFAVVSQINSLPLVVKSLAPAFLHFGILHLVFNMLWLWYFGIMIEALQSSWRYLLLVIFLSFAANTAQFIY